MTQRIPLVVLGGFLGAGKTTLLNHLLANAGGRRIAVLVNDFGPINVDAGLIEEHDGETISLTNGCVCCSMGSGLEDALIRVLDRKPPADLIVIEASGVSDPGRIAQVGLSDPMLQLEAVVVMADSEHLVEQLDDPLLGDTLARQVRAASVLVLNKTDLVSPARLRQLRARILEQFGSMAMVEAEQARVPASLLVGDSGLLDLDRYRDAVESRAEADAAAPSSGHMHSHEHVAQVEASSDAGQGLRPVPAQALSDDPDHPFEGGAWHSSGVLDADLLINALKSLPRSVIRVKGWVTTTRHGAAIVHLAGGRLRFERLPRDQQLSANQLVYIGVRSQDIHAAVRDSLAALLDNTCDQVK